MNEIRKQRRKVSAMLAKGHASDAVVSVCLAQADTSALKAMAEQWLKEEVQRQARAEVREVERQVFETPAPLPKPNRSELRAARRQRETEITAEVERRAARPVAATRLLDSLLPLLDKSLSLGDGRPVTWGDATRDDFHKRREMLTGQARGISETVGFIDQALGILLSTGVKRLNDLRGEVAA